MDHGPLIARQRAYFLSGATATPGFRRDRLRDLQSGLIGREPELLDALRADLRKNPHEAYASEIGFVLGEVRHAIKHLPRWVKPERRRAPFAAWPSRAELRHEAYGVSLIIGPWNYPLQLLLAPLVGAIAAGNTAVLKPSEFAPHTAAVISAMIKERFEEDFIAVVEGARDCAEALLREKFDKIFFTGSTGTGRLVMTAAARHLTPVTLELGGKCPCIVAADAPVELTARRIVWGKFMNAGQTCVAPDHLWVDRRIGASLLDALRREIRRFYGENPQHSPDYGRIINGRHFDRLQALLADGRIIHGGRADAQELYIEPTILTDVPADCAAMREEIFGPILPVMEFDDPGDVLAIQRDLPPPLALYLFTADRGLQERLLSATRSGGVCINDTISHIIGNDLPFGGVGESGMGTYHGRAGFDCFSQPRSVLRRSLRIDPAFRYPPPQASLETLKRVMRYFG
jgi:aldehyde dehydrogenase (NAD+)